MRGAIQLAIAAVLGLAGCDSAEQSIADGSTRLDAAQPDAGRIDAGMDAAVVEEGGLPLMDATPRDSGIADAADAGSADAREPDETSLTIEEYCEAWYEKNCEWVQRCFGTASCEGDLGPMDWIRETCPTTIAAVNAGRVEFDAARARECLDHPITCGDYPPHNSPECRGLFHAAVEEGGACYTGSTFETGECKEGYCNGCPGTCQPFSSIDQLGDEKCGQNSCDQGLSCELIEEEQVWRCAQIAAEGEPCSSLTHCSDGLYCVDGKCAARIAIGAPCQFDFECGSNAACRFSFTRQSTVCVTLVGLGDNCDGGLTGCPEGTHCGGSGAYPRCTLDSTEGESCAYKPCHDDLLCLDTSQEDGGASDPTCVAHAGSGESCSFPSQCEYPLRCLDGECRPRGGIGSPCESRGDCDWTTYCGADGRCAAERRPGQSCDPEGPRICDDFVAYCGENSTCVATCQPPTQ